MSSSEQPNQPENPTPDTTPKSETANEAPILPDESSPTAPDSISTPPSAASATDTASSPPKPAVATKVYPGKTPKKADEIETQPEKSKSLKVVKAKDSAALSQTEHKTDTITPSRPPWTLQQFFDGEIDLDVELSKRFPSIPVMSTIRFRNLGSKTTRGVGTLSTQDGAASLIVDVDSETRIVQLSFTYGSMLTLRFTLDNLSSMDQSRWIELMRRKDGGLAFLWGAERWEQDYLICIGRKYFTNLFAFSPHSFEAAVRLTPEVATQLLGWLEGFWTEPPAAEEPPQLITW